MYVYIYIYTYMCIYIYIYIYIYYRKPKTFHFGSIFNIKRTYKTYMFRKFV